MVENEISQTSKVELNHEEGLRFAQWGLMRVYVENDCFSDEWQQARSPKGKPNIFWLEKPGKGTRISPVYGVIEIEGTP